MIDRFISSFHICVSSIDLISRISTWPKLKWLLLLPLVAFALTFINALFPRLYTGAWSQCNHTHFVYLFGVFEITGCQQSHCIFFFHNSNNIYDNNNDNDKIKVKFTHTHTRTHTHTHTHTHTKKKIYI